MTTEDFSNSSENVYFKGHTVAVRTKRGWITINGKSATDDIIKETNRAITGCSNNITAQELRRIITDNLGL